jgi:predicted nucleotidyltransferase
MSPKAILGQIAELLDREPVVSFAYLFGSRAGGKPQPRPDSDVDVAVWLDTPPSRLTDEAIRLSGEMSRELGLTVDVVDLNRAPILLRDQVFRKGRLVFERDRPQRVRFESRTLVEGIDFERVRKRCAAGLTRRVRRELRQRRKNDHGR